MRFYYFVTVIVSFLLGAISAISQNSAYDKKPGDIIIIDDMECLIFKLDETGQHGKAFAPHVDVQSKKVEISKDLEKDLKKGEISQSELDARLSHIDALNQIPVVTYDKNGSKRVYNTSDWAKNAPSGWRLPNEEDCNDLSMLMSGKPLDNKIHIAWRQLKAVTNDPFYFPVLKDLFLHGCVADVNGTTKLFHYLPAQWKFVLKDKYDGKECTIAVKDF